MSYDKEYMQAWRLANSAIKLLGCSLEELKIYFESKFVTGMSWENHGEWEIDHIKPLSKFNLENLEELKIACHFTNLQPLWKSDNRIKRDKIVENHASI